MTQIQMSAGIRSSGLSRQMVMTGSAGRLAALLLLLALVVLASGCAAQSNPGAAPVADAQTTMHPVHVVRHGWHSGIVVRAAGVPLSPTLSPTSDALFAKLRRQGQVIRPPPRGGQGTRERFFISFRGH